LFRRKDVVFLVMLCCLTGCVPSSFKKTSSGAAVSNQMSSDKTVFSKNVSWGESVLPAVDHLSVKLPSRPYKYRRVGDQYEKAVKQKVKIYKKVSNDHFKPIFLKRKLVFPPRFLALLIFKNSKTMQIYVKQNKTWNFVEQISVKAASGGLGPKYRQGDRQVPEGAYRIIKLNPYSKFFLSMELNYPNKADHRQAKIEHRTRLGGDIYIHGGAKSEGCIAVGNQAMKWLFPLVYDVSRHNTMVIIAPKDFRIDHNVSLVLKPWVLKRYVELKQDLSLFPLPSDFRQG
jgi:hypothetical protein